MGNVIWFGVSTLSVNRTSEKGIASAKVYRFNGSLSFYKGDMCCFEIGMGLILVQGQFRVSLYLAAYIMGANP